MNRRNIILLVIFNLIILAELIFSLYEASKDPENVTFIFVQYFVLLMLPTFIFGRIILKKLVKKQDYDSSQTINQELEKQKLLYSQLKEKEELFKDYEVLQKPASIKGLIRKKAFLGRLGLLFIIIMAISFLDGCVNRLLHPMNLINILPGQSIPVNAPLDEKINDVKDLSYTSTSDMIKLQFESIYSGFWIGGTEWRGILTVAHNIKPGEYKLTINIKENESKKPFVFIVRVHENMISLKKSSMSLIKRTAGVSPWIVFASSIFLIAIVVILMLKLSNKIESIMLQNGQAEVFFIRRGEYVTEIVFGLGKKNNIKPGDVLNIYTENGVPVGNVIVQNSTDENSIGIVKAEHNIKPGFIVAVKK